uniref:Uncharacterized protein n=1 Tax=Oryza glaberrima TaxID=4538 RepID=I1NLK1_ORYGL
MAAAAVGVASRARRSSGPRGVAFCRWTNGLLHPRFVFPEAAAVAGSWAGSAQGTIRRELPRFSFWWLGCGIYRAFGIPMGARARASRSDRSFIRSM